MTKTKPGRPQPTPLCFEYEDETAFYILAATEQLHGGWNAETRTIAPFRNVRVLLGSTDISRFALDSICAAYEAGALREASDIAPLFVTKEDRRALLDWLFVSQGEWVNERHYSCFVGLFGPLAPESAASYKGIGEYLGEYVLEDAF